MHKGEIQNLIKELIEKTKVVINQISITEDKPTNLWVSVEVNEPHFFISRDGEGLHALNHLIHRIIENKNLISNFPAEKDGGKEMSIIVDINGFQKKHVEGVRAVAHMMSERARYFKSSVEVDPMPAFERRIIHEFLSDALDVKTESVGVGRDRRVVIKYIGTL